MIAIGLVITFVGLGDKGFKTLELKLIGPSLVGCGVFFALLRDGRLHDCFFTTERILYYPLSLFQIALTHKKVVFTLSDFIL